MIYFAKSEKNRFSYADWKTYFQENDARRLNVPFEGDVLTEPEKELVFPSIRQFERGESSEGKHLKKAADAFAREIRDRDYADCIRWFIKEENAHSGYLKTYMDHYHVREQENVILDWVFRRLRKLSGLQCEVIVLVTAEMIALAYYDALRNATGSQALKAICGQMLHDEVAHVTFQSYTLSHFRQRGYVKLLRILLMEVTSVATWISCRKVFAAGGWTFHRFLRENLCHLEQSMKLSERKFG